MDCSRVLKLIRPARAWTEMRPSVLCFSSRPPGFITISTTRKFGNFTSVFAVCPDCHLSKVGVAQWRSFFNSVVDSGMREMRDVMSRPCWRFPNRLASTNLLRGEEMKWVLISSHDASALIQAGAVCSQPARIGVSAELQPDRIYKPLQKG